MIVLSVLLSATLLAQSRDSLATAKKEAQPATQEVGVQPRQASDTSAAGARMKMDRFIDEDGDGICDHRASGLGFQRHKRMQTGKGDARTGTDSGTMKKKQRRGTR
jgi:hypothetical protein